MTNNLNLTGSRFYRLVVIAPARISLRTKGAYYYWKCLCDCGSIKTIRQDHLIKERTRSCGCLQKERVSQKNSLNLVGKKFTRLTVLSRQGSDIRQESKWLCICDCGQKIIAIGGHLQSNHTKSCGCLLHDVLTTHGMSKTPVYRVWANMIKRCTNPNNPGWKDYGGRGITVCEEWYEFKNFFKDMGLPPKGLTLERINNNGNYEPDNCCWATRSEQNSNKRSKKTMGATSGKTL